MDFSTPWTPILRGQQVRSFSLLDFAESVGTSPETKVPTDESWTADAQSSELKSVAKAPRDALLETVFRLWRLKEIEEYGSGIAMWADMVEAWLVRSESG
jgi:hypothetical protein